MASLSIVENYIPASVYFVVLVCNLLSLSLITSLKNILTKDVSLLATVLAVTSAVAMFLLDLLFLFGDQNKTSILTHSCLAVPVVFHFFLPHILAISSKFICGSAQKACSCTKTFLFTMFWIFAIIHLAVLLSPLKTLNLNKFGSTPNLSEETRRISKPVMQVTAVIPQTISIVLSFLFLWEIWQFREELPEEEKVQANNKQEPLRLTTARLYCAEYNLKWGASSILFVIPSIILRLLAFAWYNNGYEVPISLTYLLMIPDTLLFMTQPIFLTLTWWNLFKNQRFSLMSGDDVMQSQVTSHSGPLSCSGQPASYQFRPIPSISPIPSVETNFHPVTSQQVLLNPKMSSSSSMNCVFDPRGQQVSPQRIMTPTLAPMHVATGRLSPHPGGHVIVNVSPHPSRSNLFDPRSTGQPGSDQLLRPAQGLFPSSSMSHIPLPVTQGPHCFGSTQNMIFAR